MNKKINKYLIGYLTISIFLFAFIFRDLILNISTNLIDWRDYSYVVWVINQAIDNFKGLVSNDLFNGNAFYPLEGILLFSDLLWPQALITLFFSLFTSNIITQFNLMFILTLALNTIAIYLFWKSIFKKNSDILFSSLLTNFSPFFFLELSHFQMISYWPFFLSLSFLFKKKKKLIDIILIGIFLSIQFYAAVYWSIFLLTIIGVYYLIEMIKKEKAADIFKELFVIASLFFIFVGPVFFKYLQVKNAYNINREYHEYVMYSAHISDYLFNNYYQSAISQISFFTKMNAFNKHGATSATLVVYTLSLFGILTFKKKKDFFSIKFSLKKNDLIFLTITLLGFIFSLGPKLSFNGQYLGAPLPFAIALKYFIIFDPIRATIRFSALFFIGLFYFATKGLKKLNKKNNFIFVVLALLLFLLEIIPIESKSEKHEYYSYAYDSISNVCGVENTLLEYPFEQDSKDANILTNLKYKASQLTASVKHKCNLVNGYAGFDPQEYKDYITKFNNALVSTDSAKLNTVINEKRIGIIKINKEYLSDDKLQQLKDINIQSDFGEIILEDTKYLILKTNKTKNE